MTVAQRDELLAYRDQLGKLTEQIKRKETKKLKAVAHYLTEMNAIAEAYALEGVSKTLFLGLNNALRNIRKSESALGLVSDDFERLAEKLAEGLSQVCFKKEDPVATKLLKYFLEMVVIGVCGLIHLATKVKKKGNPKEFEEEEKSEDLDLKYYKELVLNLFFWSEYPKEVFHQMAQCFETSKMGFEILKEALETIGLLTALMALSEKEIDEKYLKSLIPRFSFCINQLSQDLTEVKAEESEIENAAMRAWIRQAKMACEQQDVDSLVSTFGEILQSSGFQEQHLKEDIEAIKKLFEDFEEAFLAKKSQKAMSLEVIG